MGWCKVLYLPPLFVRQMTPTHPSHHTTTSHVFRAAVLMCNVVVYVGLERYRQLRSSSYWYQNSRWPFLFHLSPTRHQTVARLFALTNFFLCYSAGLAGNYFGRVCSVLSSASFKCLLEHGFLPWAAGRVHFQSVLLRSNREVWLHLVACVKFTFKDLSKDEIQNLKKGKE